MANLLGASRQLPHDRLVRLLAPAQSTPPREAGARHRGVSYLYSQQQCALEAWRLTRGGVTARAFQEGGTLTVFPARRS